MSGRRKVAQPLAVQSAVQVAEIDGDCETPDAPLAETAEPFFYGVHPVGGGRSSMPTKPT